MQVFCKESVFCATKYNHKIEKWNDKKMRRVNSEKMTRRIVNATRDIFNISIRDVFVFISFGSFGTP
jgi:hypothetical protein